jgi:hypothetical protein
MARKINQAPSTQITQLATDDILYVARPSGLSDHWIKGQKISAINPGEGDLQYYTGGNWQKTNGLLSWDGSIFTINGVPVTVHDELVGGQSASAILQTPTVAEDGYVVSWDNTAGEFTLTPILESISLDQLSDVDLSGAADNDLLYRSGGQWVGTAGGLTYDGTRLYAGGLRLGSASANGYGLRFNGVNQMMFHHAGTDRFSITPNVFRPSLVDNTQELGSTTLRFKNVYQYTSWLAEQTPPTSGDITGMGRAYASDVDGLIYWRDGLGNVYDLTAAGSPGGAEHELQENDGAGGFRGTKVFSSADGDLTLGDSGLASGGASNNARVITIEGVDDHVGLEIRYKGNAFISIIGDDLLQGNLSVGGIGSGASGFLKVQGNIDSLGSIFIVSNDANTSAAEAIGRINVGGASANDPYLSLSISNTRNYGIGIDNSDDDKLKIVTGTGGTMSTPSTGTELMSMLPDGLITWNQTLNDATGDEVAFTITPTIDKLTSGNYTGLLLDVTETAAPGTDNRLIDLKVGGSSKFVVDNSGRLGIGGAPLTELYILETGASVTTLLIENSNVSAQEVNIRLKNANGEWELKADDDGDFFRIANFGTASYLAINSSGNVGIGGNGVSNPLSKLHIDQSSATGAIPVLILDQADDSEEMIEFVGTIGVGNAIEAVGAKSLTTTHFIKVTLPGGLTRYLPVGTIA